MLVYAFAETLSPWVLRVDAENLFMLWMLEGG